MSKINLINKVKLNRTEHQLNFSEIENMARLIERVDKNKLTE